MRKLRYIPWAADDLGITFSLDKGRIQIFKKTLETIQFPEYCHFLFNHSHSGFCTYEPLICVKPGMILED